MSERTWRLLARASLQQQQQPAVGVTAEACCFKKHLFRVQLLIARHLSLDIRSDLYGYLSMGHNTGTVPTGTNV